MRACAALCALGCRGLGCAHYCTASWLHRWERLAAAARIGNAAQAQGVGSRSGFSDGVGMIAVAVYAMRRFHTLAAYTSERCEGGPTLVTR